MDTKWNNKNNIYKIIIYVYVMYTLIHTSWQSDVIRRLFLTQ